MFRTVQRDVLISGNLGFQVTELPFFATKVRLGRAGAEEILPLGPLNEFERYVSSTLFVT
jgi:hypothetical protein